MANLIAICGNVGSGKSTLTRALGERLGWRIIAVEERSSSYVEDLFSQPRRWSFEAQMSYLVRKTLGIMAHAADPVPVLVDRALEEDIDIFARYWAEMGALDARAFDLYRDVARLMTEVLPAPFAYVFCKAGAAASRARVAERSPRHHAAFVPDVERLEEMYERWWRDLDAPRKLLLDSEDLDFRDPAVVESVADRLIALGVPGHSEQLALLEGRPERADGCAAPEASQASQDAPQIYLAGPFTAVTAEEDDGLQDRLFAAPRQVMPRGSYWRTIFEATAQSLESQGWRVFLPHRDVSRWGGRTLGARVVAEECIGAVRASDAVLAIPGISFGTHVELGLALGRRIPTVLVRCPGFEMSYFANGLVDSTAVGELAVEDMSLLPVAVASDRFREALETAFAGVRNSSA